MVNILHTNIRHYDSEGKIIKIYGEDISDALIKDKTFEYDLLTLRDLCFPRVKFKGNMMYFVVSDGRSNGETFIIGPNTISDVNSVYCGSYELTSLSYIECILMLADCFYKNQLSVMELVDNIVNKDELETEIFKGITEVDYSYQEKDIPQNP